MKTIWYIVAVEAVIYHDGRYLTIVRSEQDDHAPGTLTFPGGKVEDAGVAASILEQTLHREVMEEVGVEICPEVVCIRNDAFYSDGGDPIVMLTYLCRWQGGEPIITDPSEVSAIEWMTAEQILNHPKAPPWTHRSLLAAESARKVRGW